MRTLAAALLISMAFMTPAMAQMSEPKPNPICEIFRPTKAAALRVPGNEYAQPGRVLDLRRVVVEIVLRLAGCRKVAAR
ncbi:MAG: hypothetical protein ABWZ27_04835 [Aestuariivirgaceae bacterium]